MRPIHQFLSATALASAILLPGVAIAQDEPAAEAAPAEEAADEGDPGIIVTGSRIARPGLTSVVPVTTMQAGELFDTGNISLGDALNQLPSMHQTFGQANSGGFIGTAGLNLLDLRGLGTSRTLVLVNGRRHVTAQPGTPSSIDVNTVPIDLLERVDVVTGGNSAVYGSDAVAGVVNFILRRDFEGIKLRAQGGATGRGDRGTYLVAGAFGKNFADGRGNIAAALEYTYADDVYYTDRDDLYGPYSGRPQFNIQQNTLGEPAAGDGIPDNVFLRVRNNNISEGGTFASTCPAAVAAGDPNFAAVQARRALNCTGQRSNTGAELGYSFMFDTDGSLRPNVCVRDLRQFGSNNCVGGNGSTLRLTGQLLPRLERKSANVLTSFEVSPAFRLFAEGKFIRIEGNQEGQPTSIANLQGTYSINNPFLTAQARDVLVRSLAPGATTFSIQRFNVDFGGRGEEYQRDTFRLVGGFDGQFNDDWRYEVAVNYGQTDTHFDATNRILIPNFVNAANAVRNAQGTIVCGINADADQTNNDAACVPINVFGNGNPSAAALDYVSADVFRDERATQFVASAFLSGDLSQLFELPGGPVYFAFGGEYREETASSTYDPITASGVTDFNVILPFNPPKLRVKEAYGEIRVPLLKDAPFFQELSFEAAGRISDYGAGGGNTGTVYTYNLGGIYSPVEGVRFRGGYARSVRAPTLVNLFRPPSQTFLNGLIDPCSQTNINNGTANRAANCAAAGVPTTEVIAGVTVPWTNVPSSGIRGLNGSNPNLEEERGTSLTLGAVFQPQMIPGLSLTVDYYNIRVDNVIFTLGAQTVIDLCYDSAGGINNQYCAAVTRRPDGTFGAQSNRVVGGTTVQYPISATDSSFLAGPFNFAKQKTSGVDFDASYQTRLGGVGVNLRGIVSYLINRDNYTNVNDPTFRDRVKSELNDPEFAGSLEANFDFGMVDLGYNLRWIGKQTIDFYETTHTVDGRAPTDLDKFPVVWTPNTFYHSFRLGFEPVKSYRFYFGVDNLFDRSPPFGFDGTCATGGVFACSGGVGTPIFDNIGRFFYAGATVKF